MKLNSSFKRALAYTLSVALVLTSISFDDSYLLKAKAETATGSQSQSAGATAISAIVDNDSTYIPTSLINGGFDSEPWMKYINEDGATVLSVNKLEVSNKKIKETDGVKEITPNGINEGWNSTEEVTSSESELPVFFKWTNDCENSGLDSSNGYFIEQNAGNTEEAACQYQDITTNPGDVIRWGFKGTISENNAKHVSIEIGGFDFASSQVGEGAGIQTNSNLEKQSYYFEIDEVNTWMEKQGVYVVPEGQNATRFAVIPNEEPAGEDNGSGVYLDDFYFDTLLGNLKAVRTEDGDIVLSGYWGESDTSKNLIVNTAENQLTIVMSEVCNSNFKLLRLPIPQMGFVP